MFSKDEPIGLSLIEVVVALTLVVLQAAIVIPIFS